MSRPLAALLLVVLLLVGPVVLGALVPANAASPRLCTVSDGAEVCTLRAERHYRERVERVLHERHVWATCDAGERLGRRMRCYGGRRRSDGVVLYGWVRVRDSRATLD